MASSVVKKETAFSKLEKLPPDIGNCETQVPYIIMEDRFLDEHFKNAKKGGANIITELRTEVYGGRNYSCADLEGHLWSFSSYDPGKPENK